jgi:hypothetical protein
MSNKKKLSIQELNRKKQNRLNEAERLGIIGVLESGTPIREVARQTRRSVQTIWKLKENAKEPLPQVEYIKKRLSGKMWERIDKAEDILSGKLDSMSGRELVGTVHYGILDARLMDDQSTANVAQIIGIDPALRQALAGVSLKMRKRMGHIVEGEDGNSKNNNETSGQD